MSAANGPAFGRPILLGDLTPERRPVQVERAGETVTLWAHQDGPRCPGYVKARVEAARTAYSALVYVDGPPDDDGRRERVFVDNPQAWDEYLREVLLAVIDGLLYPEAEVLAGNQTLAIDALTALGWVRDRDGESVPEASGEASSSTTDDSSPDSPGSTTASRRKRS